MRHSSRSEVDPFIVMDVMEAARAAEEAGRDIVHMEVGQPGSGAPQAARDRLAREMEGGPLGYTVALGRPDLRAEIAALYGEWYDLDLDPARVVLTSGASGGFLLAFTALFDAGERVALGEPCYPSYRQILTALSLEPVGLVTDADTRFQPVASQLTADLAGLIVASPANPTGTMLGEEEMRALSEGCAEKGHLSHLRRDLSRPAIRGPRGERAGSHRRGLCHQLLLEVFLDDRLAAGLDGRAARSRPPGGASGAEHVHLPAHASQVAALGALSAEGRAELDEHRHTYARNRKILLEGLHAAGLTKTAPADGAFYVYVDVGHLTDDSLALSSRILAEAGVAVTPGLDFDKGRGHRTLRLSYARGTAEIEKGVARLTRFFGQG
jgi:aspartate/methionine/tyrosine aminotransferase